MATKDFIKEVFDILESIFEPNLYSFTRRHFVPAIGADLSVIMVAGRIYGLALRYHFAANGAYLVAGVAVFGACGFDCIAEFGDVLVLTEMYSCRQQIVITAANTYCIPLCFCPQIIYISKISA